MPSDYIIITGLDDKENNTDTISENMVSELSNQQLLWNRPKKRELDARRMVFEMTQASTLKANVVIDYCEIIL
jgi:hypothetical protein